MKDNLFLDHVVAGELPLKMLGDQAVFEAVELERGPGCPGGVQGLDLGDHPGRQALVETPGDTPTQLGALPAQAEDLAPGDIPQNPQA